jgi:hypothetical protein
MGQINQRSVIFAAPSNLEKITRKSRQEWNSKDVSSKRTKTEAEVDRQVQVIKNGAAKLLADPKGAKAFLVKHGHITSNGELSAQYRSK